MSEATARLKEARAFRDNYYDSDGAPLEHWMDEHIADLERAAAIHSAIGNVPDAVRDAGREALTDILMAAEAEMDCAMSLPTVAKIKSLFEDALRSVAQPVPDAVLALPAKWRESTNRWRSTKRAREAMEFCATELAAALQDRKPAIPVSETGALHQPTLWFVQEKAQLGWAGFRMWLRDAIADAQPPESGERA
jgi:hypothetical protein